MIVDIFAGAGGLSEGLRLLGLPTVGLEVDPDMVATARAAGHDAHVGDVAVTDPVEWTRGQSCTGLVGGPPCPSFSAGGKGLGRQDLPAIHQLIDELARGVDNRASTPMLDERSVLTAEPMRWIHALAPEWVLLEQVPAVLPAWQQMAETLAGWGYSTWAGVLYAERYGVPQTRQRAVLLASTSHAVGEPAPTHRRYYSPTQKAASEPPDACLPRWVSMCDALGWGMTDRPYPVLASARTTGGPDKEKVGGSGARAAIYAEREAGRWVHEQPRQHDGAVRVSLDDVARLQSFDSGYPWYGTATKQFMQITNAVPPLLARAAAAEAVGGEVQALAA